MGEHGGSRGEQTGVVVRAACSGYLVFGYSCPALFQIWVSAKAAATTSFRAQHDVFTLTPPPFVPVPSSLLLESHCS